MTELKIMHWNILAAISADNTEMGFPHTLPEYLNWEHRRELIIKMIRDENPDLVSLVEVDKQQRDDLIKEFSNDYKISHYFKENTSKETDNSSKDGSMILIKKLHYLSVIYFNAHQFKYNEKKYSQIIHFANIIINGRRLIFSSIHLKAKKDFTQDRIKQVREVKHYLRGFDKNTKIIIAGDFNDDPNSVPIEMMRDNYQMISDRSQITTFKRRKDYKKATIDFIFGSYNLSNSIISADIPKEYLAHDPKYQENAFPCDEFPSDHLYLIAKIKI